MRKLTVTKIYRDFPAAHRQPKHDGHCRLIHGHNWRFDITFECEELDENGFVVDVGKLEAVKAFLVDHFDHTLLLNRNDPYSHKLNTILVADAPTLAKVVLVDNCGMEGLANFVAKEVQDIIKRLEVGNWIGRRLRVVQVTCWEDSKNSATYVA